MRNLSSRWIGATVSCIAFSCLMLISITFTARPADVLAAETTLRWSPSSSSGVAGYRVYYGESSGTYSQVLDAGKSTICFVGNLLDDRTYYFSVVGYDAQNCESDFSPEIVYPGLNIAASADVFASSQDLATGRTARRAVDGLMGGNSAEGEKEWATLEELAGAWIRLSWNDLRQINRIVLYDRANELDQILEGTLFFSDGSTHRVGPLANDGSGTIINFPPKETNEVVFVVDRAKGRATGLSEIEAFADPMY